MAEDVDVLDDVSRRCANVPSFGEELHAIRAKRRLSQKDMSRLINRSEAAVSLYLNNQLPKHFGYRDISELIKCLNCDRTEGVKLRNAFTCYLLNERDGLNLDLF